MKFTTTFDKDVFASLDGVKRLDTDKIYVHPCHASYPNMKKLVNRKFYVKYKDSIMAFRIHAWTWRNRTDGRNGFETYYYLSTPFGLGWWKLDKFYDSIDDLTHERNAVKVEEHSLIGRVPADKFRVGSDTLSEYTMYFKILSSFYMDNNGRVTEAPSRIVSVVGTEDEMIILLEHKDPSYKETKEEVLRDKYDGMKVIDFGDEINITINIKATTAPKTYELRAVEKLQ